MGEECKQLIEDSEEDINEKTPILKKEINENNDTERRKFKRSDVFVIISMALIQFIGLCAFSLIAPFFPQEVQYYIYLDFQIQRFSLLHRNLSLATS